MAPKKNSSSSASTKKSSNSSPSKSTRSSSTSKAKSPNKVTKTSPHKKASRTRAQQLEESIADTITPQRRSADGVGKHAHFDKHVYPLNEPAEDLMNTEEATPESSVYNPTPKPRDKRIPTPKPLRCVVIAPQVSAQPNKPSFEINFHHQHTRNKPDPAKGESYEVVQDGEVVFDARETFGYLSHYKDLFEEVNDVQTKILSIAKKHFGFSLPDRQKKAWLLKLDNDISKELQRYIGALAVGGPCAVAGWEEIFLEPEMRIALVAGMVWTAIKQHVFEDLWFGASKGQITVLQKREHDLKDEECGFERSKKRAEFLRCDKAGPWRSRHHSNIDEEKIKIAVGIFHLLEPLLGRQGSYHYEADILTELLHVVNSSVKLHHSMHLDGDTVYQWAVTPKDWVYDRQDVRVSTENHWNWLFDPQNRAAYTEADPEVGLDKQKTDRVHRYGFLSRIVVFEPLEAYRKGGWRRDSQQIGQRRKLIVKGAVACRWGAVRRFGAKAKPGEGEFVELRDCRRKVGKGEEWWLSAPGDPAIVAKNVPILGLKGKGCQPDLTEFKPGPFATV